MIRGAVYRSVDIDYVVGDPVDYLTRGAMAEVELANGHYLGIVATLNSSGSPRS